MKKIYMMIIMMLIVCGLSAVHVEELENGTTFGTIREQINDNFGRVKTSVDSLGLERDTLDARVTINEADIDTLKTRLTDATVFAYLNNHTQTLPDTAYAWVDGAFVNSVIENFIAVADTTMGNYIQYTGTESIIIFVTGNMSLEVADSSTVDFALKIGNGDFAIQAGSVITMSVLANEDIVSMGGSYMCEIDPLDKIQIMMRTSKTAGTDISRLNMSVSLIRIK